MKKNITINLYGTLYAIDEDACDLLEKYLENMKKYFCRRENGYEIADDIEHRVAELLSELKASGVEAINIDHVRTIIERVGNPEQMDGGTAEADGADAAPEQPHGTAGDDGLRGRAGRWISARRFYRDPNDCLIGGVASGLSKYFGASDPLPWRIILVLLAVMSFSIVAVLYLIVWAVTPAARTPEERLWMQGRHVTPQTLKEEIMSPPPASNRARYAGSTARSFLGTLLVALLYCCKLFLLCVLTAILLSLLAAGGCLATLTFATTDQLMAWWDMSPDTAQAFADTRYLFWFAWGAVFSGLVSVGILLYAVVRWLIVRPGDKSLSQSTCIALTVVCLISATAAITLAVVWGMRVKQETDAAWRRVNTVDGVFLRPSDRQTFTLAGWRPLCLKNCDDSVFYTSSTDDFGGSEPLTYLSFEKRNPLRPMQGKLERSERLPAGRYHLEAVCYAQGPGASLYVQSPASAGGALLQNVEIPSQNVNGKGNMANMTATEARATRLYGDTLTDVWWASEGNKKAESWSYVRTPAFVHGGGDLAYGLRFDMRAGADEVGLYEVYVVAEAQSDSVPRALPAARK